MLIYSSNGMVKPMSHNLSECRALWRWHAEVEKEIKKRKNKLCMVISIHIALSRLSHLKVFSKRNKIDFTMKLPAIISDHEHKAGKHAIMVDPHKECARHPPSPEQQSLSSPGALPLRRQGPSPLHKPMPSGTGHDIEEWSGMSERDFFPQEDIKLFIDYTDNG